MVDAAVEPPDAEPLEVVPSPVGLAPDCSEAAIAWRSCSSRFTWSATEVVDEVLLVPPVAVEPVAEIVAFEDVLLLPGAPTGGGPGGGAPWPSPDDAGSLLPSSDMSNDIMSDARLAMLPPAVLADDWVVLPEVEMSALLVAVDVALVPEAAAVLRIQSVRGM